MGAPVAWAGGLYGIGSVGGDPRHGRSEDPPLPRRARRRRSRASPAVRSDQRRPVQRWRSRRQRPFHTEGNNAALPCVYNQCEHGTHVAGIAAGANGPSIAPSGVAPGANIVAVKVVSKDPGSNAIGAVDSDVLAGLDWVNAHRADVQHRLGQHEPRRGQLRRRLRSGRAGLHLGDRHPASQRCGDGGRFRERRRPGPHRRRRHASRAPCPSGPSRRRRSKFRSSRTLSRSFDFLAPGAANNEDPNGPLFEGVWSSVPTTSTAGRLVRPWPRPTWRVPGR